MDREKTIIIYFDTIEKSYEITLKEWNEISHLCNNYSIHYNDDAHKHWHWKGISQLNKLIRDNKLKIK
tara:strand:+ start:51 stop:254 length:204 start_codon:yes stop_codon:yes gene_type:complete